MGWYEVRNPGSSGQVCCTSSGGVTRSGRSALVPKAWSQGLVSILSARSKDVGDCDEVPGDRWPGFFKIFLRTSFVGRYGASREDHTLQQRCGKWPIRLLVHRAGFGSCRFR